MFFDDGVRRIGECYTPSTCMHTHACMDLLHVHTCMDAGKQAQQIIGIVIVTLSPFELCNVPGMILGI